MLNQTWIGHLLAGGVGLTLLACGALTHAEEPRQEVRRLVIIQNGQPAQVRFMQEGQRGERREPGRVSEYWLGLQCFPIEAALRAQLNLGEGEGVMVDQIVPDSPAAKAELKQYDCILKAAGKPVKSLADLMQAVDEAKDNELPLDVIRGGKAMTIKVTPAKRPEPQDVLRRPPQLPAEELRRWMENFNRGEPNQFRYRIFGPGAVLPGEKGLPKGLSVSITRSGDEPAKITVKKDDQSWDVTEKELDKLPDDVRPHVERMLGRGGASVMAFPPATPVPGAVPAPVRPEIRRPDGQSDRQLKEMMDQVDRLRRQMEELQKNLPRDGKPGETRT